ncbi:MAG: hypothetical protein HW405_863 [Candidatus Berkelbacteria bacterium]|nr:hypothetical protein [Candidatus Berkelbacteria bacterium]
MTTVVFLSVLVIIGGYGIYIISVKSYRYNTQYSELTQNARIALERMSRDIRQSMEIVTTLPPDPGSGTPPSEIKFQDGHNFWPGPTSSPTPLPSVSSTGGKIQYITYFLDWTDLHRKVSHYAFTATPTEWVVWSAHDLGGNPPQEFADSDDIKSQMVTNLQFWGINNITIHLTVSDGTNTQVFETQSLGRNIQ